MFHRLNDKGDNSLTEISGCPEKRIEHIFLFHYTFFLPEFKLFMHLSSTRKGYKLMRIYIPELGFSSRDFGSKYHNLYSTTPCLMRPIFRTPFNGRNRQVWLYIMATSFSAGRNWSTRREPPTMGKQLVNFITCGCESSTPFFVTYKAGCEPRLYWW